MSKRPIKPFNEGILVRLTRLDVTEDDFALRTPSRKAVGEKFSPAPTRVELRDHCQRMHRTCGEPLRNATRQIQLEPAIHPLQSLVIPAVSIQPKPIDTLPEATVALRRHHYAPIQVHRNSGRGHPQGGRCRTVASSEYRFNVWSLLRYYIIGGWKMGMVRYYEFVGRSAAAG